MARRIVALLLFFFCAAYTYAATRYRFGSPSVPGAGFVPMVVGATGTILAGITAVQSLMAEAAAAPDIHFRRVVLFVVVLFAFVLVLPIIGFLPATFGAMILLFKVSGVEGWVTPVLISAALAGGLDILFAHILEITMP